MITFTNKLVIPAGETKEFYIRAGIVDGTTAGKTVALGIASADDIVCDASEVTGDFPITGNAMSVVNLTIGTAEVNEDGTTTDSQPDVGDTDVVINKFKVTAGSTEAITIEQITVMKAGTADASDTGNIELYDVTNGVSLGTVDSWDAEGKASWSNLNIVVDKGKTQRFKVMVDILDGSGLTVNADLTDGSDVLMTVKGNTYGFYITPTISGSWNGKGSNDTTIQSGALNVSKSSATPATGNISPGDDITLAVFDFDAKGEEIKISALTLDFTFSEMLCSEVTNVALYDADGSIVAGPQDCSSNSVSFTDTFIVPVGVHQYTVKADIADTVSTGDTIKVAVDRPGTSITAKGMTSNNSITATPSTDVSANTLTIAAGALTVYTLDLPAARNVAAGTTNFVWATASLDAGTSGEDIQVSTVTISDDVNTTGAMNDIDNAEIWADLTDENSDRGDVYETKVSTAKQLSGSAGTDGTQAFTLTQTITVPKGSYVRIALVADLAAGATAGGTHTFTFSAVTATGATTGQDIAESTSGSGQTMTVSAGGTLTVTKDASSPSSDIVLGGETVILGVFRLAADNVEDLDLDNITFNVTNGDKVDSFYFYHGDELLATRAGTTAPRIDLADGTVVIPANGHEEITVKAKMATVDGSVVTNNTEVGVSINGLNTVQTTGLSSGSDINSGYPNVSGDSMWLFESRPYFSLNASSPSGTLITGTTTELARFDIRAADPEDITFENGDGNSLTVNVSCSRKDSDGDNETITLVDQDGNTLDTLTQDICSTMVFDFSNNSLTIPAGQTKWVKIIGDTTELGDAGDTIQLYLDDDTATNVDWGIDGSGSYNKADIIFRGDIYAGALTTPSGSSD